MIHHPIRKFKKFARIELKGISSRGRLNCCNMDCLLRMEEAASSRAPEKNIHGKIPERAKRAKFFIPTLNTALKTKVIASKINRGFIIASHIPIIEPAYFDLSPLTAISHKVWR